MIRLFCWWKTNISLYFELGKLGILGKFIYYANDCDSYIITIRVKNIGIIGKNFLIMTFDWLFCRWKTNILLYLSLGKLGILGKFESIMVDNYSFGVNAAANSITKLIWVGLSGFLGKFFDIELNYLYCLC